MRIDALDLEFQGTPQVIAAFLLRGPSGAALIETGPASTLPALLSGLERLGVDPAEIRDVLVTHIHLDHAGAAGHWARRGSRVHVHPNGAPHLVDPSKLLASASRIYGAAMDRLWGKTEPAPADRVHAVADGETIEAAGLRIQALETPGHARHHHVYCVDGVGFTGDATGIRLPGRSWIDLPAPPPEFDLDAWRVTLGRLRAQRFRTIYRTHYGPTDEVASELERFAAVLEDGAAWIRAMIEARLDRDAMVERFRAQMRDRAVGDGLDDAVVRAYELANPRDMSVDGIARYWRRKLEAGS